MSNFEIILGGLLCLPFVLLAAIILLLPRKQKGGYTPDNTIDTSVLPKGGSALGFTPPPDQKYDVTNKINVNYVPDIKVYPKAVDRKSL